MLLNLQSLPRIVKGKKLPLRGLIRLRSLVRSNEFMLIPLALVIGCAAGAAVAAMSGAAQLAHVVIYGIPLDVRLSAHEAVNVVAALAAPAAGGLVLGWMEWSRRKLKISNATDPIEANALRGGNLSLRDSLVVSTQTLISNGCGASVGLEAGYTQLGAGAASVLGRALNLRRNDLRLMVGCGAAGAISAAFNAPLTGAFYACELVVGRYSIGFAGPILVAAISAALLAGRLGGSPYSINVPEVSAPDIPAYGALILLALVVSVIGIVVMRSASTFERVFTRKWLPVWLRPVLGGVVIGSMAIGTPQVLAAGHGAMLLDLHREMPALLILTLIILKLCACLISLASGFRGGLFFASLFVGSLVGKLYVIVLALPMISFSFDPTTAALVGMATLGVAIVGGPLTMSFLVLEMTRSLEVTAGVLAASIVTSVLVRAFFGHSFSTWRLHLRGETIRSADDIGWLRSLTVDSMMRTDVAIVMGTATVADCRQKYPLGSHRALFVEDGTGYRGTVVLAEAFSSDIDESVKETSIVELLKAPDVMLVRGMNVKAAMKAFDRAEIDILPIVDNLLDRKVIGFLTESYARRRYIEELDRATGTVLTIN